MTEAIQRRRHSDTFLVGHAQGSDWEKAAEQCLQQIGYVPPDANLGFLYVTDSLAGMLGFVLDFFREETGIPHWVGTVGVGICATAKEYHETPAMAVMVASLPPDSYRLLPPLKRPEDALLPALDDWLGRSAQHLAVVHGDPHHPTTPQILEALAERLPGGYLVGGLSSSRGKHPQILDGIAEGGVSGVILNQSAPVATALTQGCSPIGPTHRIDACERNIIGSLDGRPALDVLYEDIGEILARDINRAAGYIFAGLPIPGSDTGDYLVRNLVGIDPKHRMLAIGDLVEPGQSLQFCRRDGQSAWDDLRRMLRDLKRRTADAGPKGGLYYTCLGRGPELFGPNSEELKAIRDELGDFPLVGFFANGEIFNSRLYGYTGVLTLFL